MANCGKTEALEEIRVLEKEKQGYIIVQSDRNQLIIEFAKDNALPDLRNNEYLFCMHPTNFTKTDIGNIIKALNIKSVLLPSENIADANFFINNRPPAYTEAIKTVSSPKLKKSIFLIRRSKEKRFLQDLKKEHLIVLAKPVKVKIELLDEKFGGRTYIPVFTDSDELRAFLSTKSKNERYKDYYPLLIAFKDLKKYIAKSDGVFVNPSSFDIKGKDFSMIMKKKLIEMT